MPSTTPKAPTGWRIGFWAGALVVCVLSLLPIGRRVGAANPLYLSLGHLGAYFVLTAAGLRAFGGRAGERWVTPCMLLLGSALEASRALLPQRTANAADALVKAVGIGLAVVLHSLIDRWRTA